MRILIVEDEVKAAEYLRNGFAENGFVVDVARTGKNGLHKAMTAEYGVVILDTEMPEGSGWSVLSELRCSNKVPVLILTARDTVEDRIKGLELGADDYLVKPFVFSELLARVRTITRRDTSRQLDLLSIGGLVFDLARNKVTRGNKKLNLTPKEFALLSFLAHRAGKVVSRAEIAEQVWDTRFDGDTNLVDVAVRRLRAKVDEPFRNKLIHTQRGIGYILEER